MKVNTRRIVSAGALATIGSLAFAGAALAQDAASSLDASTEQLNQALANLNSQAAVATTTGTGLVALGVGMIIFWIIFGIGGFALWLWALIDVLRRDFKNPNDKILWIVLIIIIPWIGSIVYLAAGRKNGSILSNASSKPAATAPAPEAAKEEKKPE